jgi:hypothetical protein
MSSDTNILLLGESDSGKTHYGAQLLLRLRCKQCELSFREQPTNISAFDAAITSLNNGKAAVHTSSGVYVESQWPLLDRGGNRFDLIWPDYAGEQITHMTTRRLVTPEWCKRIVTSFGWVLMLRLHKLTISQDTFVKPLAALAPSSSPKTLQKLSDQARIIELLQILLYTKSVGTLNRVSMPQLTILLSCWDEDPDVKTGDPPESVLARRLPLIHSFIAANWEQPSYAVFGLSALEKELTDKDADTGYIDKGPESFGFVVKPDGKHTKDLTLPIRFLIEKPNR